MLRFTILLGLIFYFTISSFAQGAKFGIKAGINISTIAGQSEQNEFGEKLETTKFLPGFHLGPTFNYEFTDKAGFQIELLYSQKGGKYRYNDDSSYFLLIEPLDTLWQKSVLSTGRKSVTLTNNNGYLNLPIMFQYKIIPNLRIGAGLSFGVLLNSTGTGQMDFTGRIWEETSFTSLDRFTVVLEHKYNRDKAVENIFDNEGISLQEVLSNGTSLADPVYAPNKVGAYYDITAAEKNGRFFNTFDLGANLELVYVFDTGLHFGIRGNYSLLDVSNNNYDFNRHQLTESLEKVSRSDADKNISIQISIGFSF